MAKKKKESKKSIKEIMKNILDEELLKKRKEEKLSNEEEKIIEIKKENEIEIIKDKKWWEIPMEKEKFTIKSQDGNFFAQYEGWNKNIWIGPYETEKELNDVIKDYVSETKKNILNRNIKNIHSMILDL